MSERTFKVSTEPPEGWNELIREGEVYHTGDFLHHFFSDVFYFCAFEDGKLVSGIPLVSGTIGTLSMVASLPNFLSGGPIGGSKEVREDLVQRIRNLWFIVDSSGEKLNLPNSQEKTAEIIYFKSHEEWFKGIDEDSRNQIRQATKRGVTLCKVTKKEFNELDRKTAKKHDRKVDKIWTNKLFDFAKKNGVILSVKIRKKPIASVILLKHNKKAYLVKNISDTHFLKHRPNHFLYSEAIRWAVEHGCTQINTGGAGFKGLLHFKRSLGSKAFTYYWYSK